MTALTEEEILSIHSNTNDAINLDKITNGFNITKAYSHRSASCQYELMKIKNCDTITISLIDNRSAYHSPFYNKLIESKEFLKINCEKSQIILSMKKINTMALHKMIYHIKEEKINLLWLKKLEFTDYSVKQMGKLLLFIGSVCELNVPNLKQIHVKPKQKQTRRVDGNDKGKSDWKNATDYYFNPLCQLLDILTKNMEKLNNLNDIKIEFRQYDKTKYFYDNTEHQCKELLNKICLFFMKYVDEEKCKDISKVFILKPLITTKKQQEFLQFFIGKSCQFQPCREFIIGKKQKGSK